MNALDLLPERLRSQSRLGGEIALPYPVVLEAIEALEAQDVLLLGWEPLGESADRSIGGYPSPTIGGLAGIEIPPEEEWAAAVGVSAALHRATIEEEWRTREATPPHPDITLLFCLAARPRR